jgi:hypothetical protein
VTGFPGKETASQSAQLCNGLHSKGKDLPKQLPVVTHETCQFFQCRKGRFRDQTASQNRLQIAVSRRPMNAQ